MRVRRSPGGTTALFVPGRAALFVCARHERRRSMDAKQQPPAAVLDFREKNFRPSVVETDLYDWWERAGFFTPPATPSANERKFVMMLPLPNVTGDLHMGHALGFGGYEDLMARWHRMKGDATLYLPGTDHAGIIAQIVVEKELAKEADKKGLTREQFLS